MFLEARAHIASENSLKGRVQNAVVELQNCNVLLFQRPNSGEFEGGGYCTGKDVYIYYISLGAERGARGILVQFAKHASTSINCW